jgi:thiamine biosynthesis lipoprotein
MLPFSQTIERCRPGLGTFVRIAVRGLPADVAHEAIDAAFEEIAAVHRLMSFHDADSDVSRLNREAHREAARIDFRTYAVLASARAISEMSAGAFDVTVAPALVHRGALPEPVGAPAADADADWRDVELLPRDCVRFRKPLWIDLGGIAKGYAVDRAISILAGLSPGRACVNAGGDLRVCGRERVALAAREGDAFIILENGALASSSGIVSGTDEGDGSHIDPRRLHAQRNPRFVTVAAPSCMEADALTKVVMTEGPACADLLTRYSAFAYMHDDASGWQRIAERAPCV